LFSKERAEEMTRDNASVRFMTFPLLMDAGWQGFSIRVELAETA
jgi:hypothetical protein